MGGGEQIPLERKKGMDPVHLHLRLQRHCNLMPLDLHSGSEKGCGYFLVQYLSSFLKGLNSGLLPPLWLSRLFHWICEPYRK